MAAPVADFTFSADGGTITFTDTSTETPTSWAWDFGDGSGTSTDQNPEYTFSTTGIYAVSLTATNDDGESSHSIFIFVEAEDDTTIITILSMALCKLPSDYDQSCLLQYQRKYQALLYEAAGVDEADMFDETAFGYLWNVLISELVVWEAVLAESQRISADPLQTSSSSSSSSTSSSNGSLTKLKTGPSEAEWEGAGASSSGVSRYYGAVFGSGGLIESYQKSICSLAARLEVMLPSVCGRKVVVGWKTATVTPSNACNFWEDNGYPLTNL